MRTDSVTGTLRSNDADGNENVKKQLVLKAKQLRMCITLFLYISFLFLHDYDVEIPDFASDEGRKQAATTTTTTVYF